MALREDIEKQGAWLFRRRGFLPILMIPFLFLALQQSGSIGKLWGDSAENLWATFASIISFFGLFVRGLVAGYVPRGTSGKNTKSQVAETLNRSGMYSIVRNPLYLGNFLIVFGMALFVQVWWFAIFFCIGFLVYYERIIFTEEEFLRQKFGSQFLDWANKTPICIPNFKKWKNSDLAFSWKTVLRREFASFFSIVINYFFLELAMNFFINKKIFIHVSWIIFLLIGLGIYLGLRTLKIKTKLLDVQGR